MIKIEEVPLIKSLEYDTIGKEYVVFRWLDHKTEWFKTISEARSYYEKY